MKKLLLLLMFITLSCGGGYEGFKRDSDLDRTNEIIKLADSTQIILNDKIDKLTDYANVADSLNNEIDTRDYAIFKLKQEKPPTVVFQSIEQPMTVVDKRVAIKPIYIYDTMVNVICVDSIVKMEVIHHDTLTVIIKDTITLPTIDSSKKDIRIYKKIQKLVDKLEDN